MQSPFFQGIRPIKRAGAIKDAIAGIALAATSIPQVLGYSRIAGMPVITGLNSLLLPLLAFAALGSSRFLVVSADSATAAILAGGLSEIAPSASPRYVSLAALVALLTAGFLFLGRLLKLGFIADFLSQPVLAGFLTGVGFQVGIAVLGSILGIPTHSHKTVLQLIDVFRGLPTLQLPTVLVSATVIIGVMLLRRFAPPVPGPLLAVIASIVASAMWNLAGHGVATIGPVARGLPELGLHGIGWRDIPQLIPIAASCAVMILTQSAATSRIYAARHHQHLDANQDLVGLSAANAAAAFSGSFVVNGSPTQTSIVEGLGARSQIAHISTAVVVAVVLLFLTGPLQYLPQCVLGSLVFLVAIHLIDIRGLRDIRVESPGEFMLAITTAIVVVTVGVEQGIILAMTLSLLRIVHHSYHPLSGVMLPASDGTFQLLPVTPNCVTEPGLVLYRFGAALFYANVGRFADDILTLVGPAPTSVRWLIVDAEAIPHVDYSAARIILKLQANLADAGVTLGVARLPWDARSDFDRHHLTEAFGPALIFNRLRDAQDEFHKSQLDRSGPTT